MSVRLLVGDMRERLSEFEPESVDSCVTDPPYHLTNPGRRVPPPEVEGSPFSRHRMGVNGDPKASRGFMGQEWDGGDVAFQRATWEAVFRVLKPGSHLIAFSGTRTYHRMVCAIEDAGFEIRDQLAWIYGSGFPKSHNQPGGWGTALKPAWEPICLARRPLQGTVAVNIAKHGTGAINIDGCRVGVEGGTTRGEQGERLKDAKQGFRANSIIESIQAGRWPANIIHDGSEEVLRVFPDAPGQLYARGGTRKGGKNVYGDFASQETGWEPRGDEGSAARFFYCAKATSDERGEGNNHPTVKPVDLMRWLCRLVTPKGGTVLDPFSGSGSTLIAADAEQFNAIGCELSPEYAAIAERRLKAAAGMFADISTCARAA